MLRCVASTAFTLLSVLALAQAYVLKSFSCDIDLRPDATMAVTERIAVRFNERRHGIYRFIPMDVDNGKGLSRRLFLSHISVTDETGDRQQTEIDRKGVNLNIRIGDPDRYLEAGTQKTYVIRYEAANMMNWFEDQTWEPIAELYWNVTGDQWDNNIDSTFVRVRFPSGKTSSALRAAVYAGPTGDTTADLLSGVGRLDGRLAKLYMAPGDFRIERLAPLKVGEGLTFALDMPEDAVHKPTPMQALWMLLFPNLGLTIPIFAVVLAVLAYQKVGKDPPRGPVVVQFDPPDGVTGPEIGTFIDERVDPRDVSAGIFSLAVKGYLKIAVAEKGLIFKRPSADIQLTNKSGASDLTPFEAKLLSYLQNCDQPIDDSELRTHVAPHVPELKTALYGSLVSHGYYLKSPDSAKTSYMVFATLFVVALGFLFAWASPIHDETASIIGGVLGFLVFLAFARAMGKRTIQGAKALDQVRGFEEFIRRARGKEFDWMAQKHPDMALFEQYLPHAIAFGLAKEWAMAFDGILDRMPDWYSSPSGSGFHSSSFGNDIVSVSDSLGSAAGTPPRSSGGGGGSSGGGSGGGGGGSW